MNLAAWRDVAVVLLVVQTLVMVIVVGAVLYLLNRGMAGLRRAIGRAAPRVQARLRQVADVSEQISTKAVAPLIHVAATGAQVRSWWVSLSSLIRR
ncbi:MAG: hypothetical protein N2439_07525 [Anaerolineae bacterium]|nr:hypothetical protein [Anaerolineae bacterium]